MVECLNGWMTSRDGIDASPGSPGTTTIAMQGIDVLSAAVGFQNNQIHNLVGHPGHPGLLARYSALYDLHSRSSLGRRSVIEPKILVQSGLHGRRIGNVVGARSLCAAGNGHSNRRAEHRRKLSAEYVLRNRKGFVLVAVPSIGFA